MSQERETLHRACRCLFAGFCLTALAFFLPIAGNQPGWNFLQVIHANSWGTCLDWPNAWCSCKILLLCAGLFLILDALGSVLVKIRRPSLGQLAFYLIAIPGIGFFIGLYHLLKALF